MTNITFTADTLRYITLFESVTNASVKDCIETPDKLIFVINPNQIGKAVGKDGRNINRLKELFKKMVQIIEYSDKPEEFIKNIFRNYGVQKVEIETRGSIKHATVTVDAKEKGKAIGKEGKNLKLARDIILRHHDVSSVNVA